MVFATGAKCISKFLILLAFSQIDKSCEPELLFPATENCLFSQFERNSISRKRDTVLICEPRLTWQPTDLSMVTGLLLRSCG